MILSVIYGCIFILNAKSISCSWCKNIKNIIVTSKMYYDGNTVANSCQKVTSMLAPRNINKFSKQNFYFVVYFNNVLNFL